MNALATTTVRKNLLEREGYTPYCGEALMCTAGLPRTTWDGAQFRCRCGWRSEFPADFIAAYKARWGIPCDASTEPDFFTAMAVGIPPISAPAGPAPAPAETTSEQENE
ncbi:hypothetical protein [Stenotrophomonas sp. SMYL20]|uniref:hypothetical protein n=1 Tax=Stenotrophomonas sp. SMYL20 TaxID=3076043 RepID=UPI002E77C9ED|nr:hypothetical protein [Stenotrophomonas sp. SMYL20]